MPGKHSQRRALALPREGSARSRADARAEFMAWMRNLPDISLKEYELVTLGRLETARREYREAGADLRASQETMRWIEQVKREREIANVIRFPQQPLEANPVSAGMDKQKISVTR